MSFDLTVDLTGVPGKVITFPPEKPGDEECYSFRFEGTRLGITCDKEGHFGQAGCSWGGHLFDDIISCCPNGTRYQIDDMYPLDWQEVCLDETKRARLQRERLMRERECRE